MTLYVFYNFENVRVLYIMLFCGLPQFYADRVDDDIEGPFMFLFDLLMNEHAYVNGSSSGPRPNVTTPTASKNAIKII